MPLIVISLFLSLIAIVYILLSKKSNTILLLFLFILLSTALGYIYTSIKLYDKFNFSLTTSGLDIESIKGFSAKVISYDGININRHVYTINVDRVHDGVNWHKYNSKTRLYSYNNKMLGIGDTITSTAKIKLYSDIFTNNTDSDRQILSMLDKKSLTAVATSFNYGSILIVKRGSSILNILNKYAFSLRSHIKYALSSYSSSINYSIAQCLLIGDKYILPYSLQESFRKAGISHILVVSGLHLGIIYFIIFSLLSIFKIKHQYKIIISNIIILVFYLPLTLYQVSVMRAAFMMSLMSMSILLDRSRNLINVIFIAAFIILLGNPLSIKEISFQFSFITTFAIISTMPIFNKLISSLPYLAKYIISFFIVSILANIITTPLISNYFGAITITSIISNIYAIVMAFAIIVLNIITVILYSINTSFAIVPSFINNIIIDSMITLTEFMGSINILRYEVSMNYNHAVIITIALSFLFLFSYYTFFRYNRKID